MLINPHIKIAMNLKPVDKKILKVFNKFNKNICKQEIIKEAINILETYKFKNGNNTRRDIKLLILQVLETILQGKCTERKLVKLFFKESTKIDYNFNIIAVENSLNDAILMSENSLNLPILSDIYLDLIENPPEVLMAFKIYIFHIILIVPEIDICIDLMRLSIQKNRDVIFVFLDSVENSILGEKHSINNEKLLILVEMVVKLSKNCKVKNKIAKIVKIALKSKNHMIMQAGLKILSNNTIFKFWISTKSFTQAIFSLLMDVSIKFWNADQRIFAMQLLYQFFDKAKSSFAKSLYNYNCNKHFMKIVK
ncbi:hypothetical protein NUSPORA_00256 [Nucleospora cyclopteri]